MRAFTTTAHQRLVGEGLNLLVPQSACWWRPHTVHQQWSERSSYGYTSEACWASWGVIRKSRAHHWLPTALPGGHHSLPQSQKSKKNPIRSLTLPSLRRYRTLRCQTNCFKQFLPVSFRPINDNRVRCNTLMSLYGCFAQYCACMCVGYLGSSYITLISSILCEYSVKYSTRVSL